MAIVPEGISAGDPPDSSSAGHSALNPAKYLWEIAGVREVPLGPPRPLIQTSNSLDVDINLSELDDHNRFTRTYEEACFGEVVSQLPPHQIAYGANLLNAAFNGELKAVCISVPDAIVWEVPQDKHGLKLIRIIEARTGKIGSRLKLAGFENLTTAMRQSPDYFIGAIGNVIRGRANGLELTHLFVPDNNEIEIDFYSPKGVENDPSAKDALMRQEHIAGHPFKSVNYRMLPMPVFTAN